jgi:hypothetical protein
LFQKRNGKGWDKEIAFFSEVDLDKKYLAGEE